jgi:hypothetical protein
VAKQQLEFCQLASHLIEHAMQLSSMVPSTNSSALPESDPTEESSPSSPSSFRPERRYALMQKLPGGEYWTSLSSSQGYSQPLSRPSVACAQRVSILPSLPPSSPARPTLGSLCIPNKVAHKFKPTHLTPRQLSQGSFLNYGPYTSFAPSWDSEGAEMGRDSVGACLEYKRRRKNRRARPSADPSAVELDSRLTGESETADESNKADIDIKYRDEYDSRTEISLLLESVQLETGTDELLEQNAQAIHRLHYLQALRILRGESVVRDQLEYNTGTCLSDWKVPI